MREKAIRITARCPIRTTLEMLGGKWRLLLLYQLQTGARRPSELKRLVPDISEKMLIQELKSLVENELVHRNNYGAVPPKVEYSLTEKGQLAIPLIHQMVEFVQGYEALRKEAATT